MPPGTLPLEPEKGPWRKGLVLRWEEAPQVGHPSKLPWKGGCVESRCTSGWQGPGGLGARLSNGVVSMGFEPKADRAHSSLWKQLFSKCINGSCFFQ